MIRVGMGYDSHRFAEGRKLILGGVDIPHERGLAGHSDADALTHALIDAILGAAAMGDIGKMFPDTDERWKGADSIMLLRQAWAAVSAEGWRIANADCTVITEKPKMAPHITEMRRNLAEALGTDIENISVKAKTDEKMGFAGRGEGLKCLAAVLLEK